LQCNCEDGRALERVSSKEAIKPIYSVADDMYYEYELTRGKVEEDVRADGIWNCGGRTTINFVPPTNILPKTGSLCELTGTEIVVRCRGEVGRRPRGSWTGCRRGGGPGLGSGMVEDVPGIREVEKLGAVNGGELEAFISGGLSSSNGRTAGGLETSSA
jgi:hypothetical protein